MVQKVSRKSIIFSKFVSYHKVTFMIAIWIGEYKDITGKYLSVFQILAVQAEKSKLY